MFRRRLCNTREKNPEPLMWAKGKYGVFLDINPRGTVLAATLHSPTASNDDQGRVYCRKVKITPLADVQHRKNRH